MMKPSVISHLTPTQFLNMLRVGASRIISHESDLNSLNIFPVSDHDTGSNVSSLMRFLLAYDISDKNFKILFKQIADASLIGAAGNSGIIFSAYFCGLASVNLPHQELLSISDFLACIHAGAQEAYRSVSHPVEGTILTMMRSWSTLCQENVTNDGDYLSLFEKCLPELSESLKKTEHQLEVLEQDHKVDAGAYAFYLLVEGMRDYLLNPDSVKVEATNEECDHVATEHQHVIDANYQYCFESILLSDAFDLPAIKAKLENFGDSLVVSKSPSYLKIHLHTDNVMGVTDYLASVGDIYNQKVDDMKKQVKITHLRKHSIALLADTSADVPHDFIEKHQIHTLPIIVRLGQHNLLDRLTVNLKKLYHMISHHQVSASTAIPSTEMILRQLSYLASHYESIIVVTIASQMSSMHQHISRLAKTFPKTRITVIDSKKNSAAQGLLVMKAAELIEKGESHDDVVSYINALSEKTDIFISVQNFNIIMKSGRGPRVMAAFANRIHFNPVITCDHTGKTTVASVAFGRKMSENKMIQHIRQRINKRVKQTVGIVHSIAPEKASNVAKILLEEFGITPVFVKEISPALGIHAGEGCVAVAIMEDGLDYVAS